MRERESAKFISRREMSIEYLLLLIIFVMLTSAYGQPSLSGPRLSKPLIGEDGRVYSCSDRNLNAFEGNGSIAWVLQLNLQCNAALPPVYGGRRKIYLVAENKVLKINISDSATSPPTAHVFFGQEESGEIIGVSVSASSSSVFITIKNRGLFAYTVHGNLIWSVGPVLSISGYRQGCRRQVDDCYFNSVAMIDRCEASLYISNSAGELYSLSMRSPHIKWIQDLSSFHRNFTITPGNNGRLYVAIPIRTLILALDVYTGNVLWQRSIGPLSAEGSLPVVDSNGWISIGSLDGFLYSFSPSGELQKSGKSAEDSVIQVSPLLSCSGYEVYVSRTKVDGKISQTIGEYPFVSAMKSNGVVFSSLVPKTGSTRWSENYPGSVSSMLFKSDLQHFMLDEEILLGFITTSRFGNALPCRTTGQKLAFSCSMARPKSHNIYTGNERAILLFLFFESIVLVVFAGLVRFCCIFWRKKKLQGQNLGTFLEKRRSLQLKKKQFDRTITQLEQKAADEEVANEVIHELGELVQERETVTRKLSTTYSLGRDKEVVISSSGSKFIIPRNNYSFQSGNKKESVTVFHTLSETWSTESSSANTLSESSSYEEINFQGKGKGKGKGKGMGLNEDDSSSDETSNALVFQ